MSLLFVAFGWTACSEATGSLPAGDPVVASLELSPREAERFVGDTLTYAAVPRNAAGRELGGITLRWSSSDTAVAQVDSTGRAYANRPGEAEIIASANGVEQRARIRVVAPPEAWREVVRGCGLASDGAVYCWPLESLPGPVAQPQPRAAGLRFASLTVNDGHACGLTAPGEAFCWGSNDFGQLGDGTLTAAAAPRPVAGGLRFRELTAGELHTCGLSQDDRAYCWGANGTGQLGSASTSESCGARRVPCATHPVEVAGGLTFLTLSAGGAGGEPPGPGALGIGHTCGVSASGELYCWGANAYGQLGNATRVNAPAPVRVSSKLRFIAVAAGMAHTCALTRDGAAYCWGLNSTGQLGVDPTAPDGGGCLIGDIGYTCEISPVAVRSPVGFRAITAGNLHTCALSMAGAAFCWGEGRFGQLGDGRLMVEWPYGASAPVRVLGGVNFVRLEASTSTTCGVAVSGQPYCWGNNAPSLVPLPEPPSGD